MSDAATAGRIPLSEPVLTGNEWVYVKECLDDGWVSSAGAFVNRFEAALADLADVPEAVALASGTAALHLACHVGGIRPGDDVILPALTFIASANAVRHCQAWPVFIDIDPDYFQMDPACLQDFLDTGCERRDGVLVNKASGRPVTAVMPVHVLGHPCDMDAILEIARKYGLLVIEDAAEAVGAVYKDRRPGALGDIGAFSFNGNKIVTAGAGGALLSRDPGIAQRARWLSTQAKDDAAEYVHGEVGYNYRLTNIQAAIGLAQIERLEAFVQQRRHLAHRYTEGLTGIPGLRPMMEAPWARATYWLYTVLIEEETFGCNSRTLIARLKEHGIESRPLWQPMHRSPALTDCAMWKVSIADRIHAQAVSLPSSASLTDQDQDRVIAAIRAMARS